MLNTYKFRLYPNKVQSFLIEQHFGSVRFIYNKFLDFRIKQFESGNTKVDYYLTQAELTLLKKEEEFAWLKKINSQSLQVSLRHLDLAYQRFFKKLGGFPNFKSKKYSILSFNIPQNVKIDSEKSRLIIPKFLEGIKVKIHREIKPSFKIKQATISRIANQYYVSILVDDGNPEPVLKEFDPANPGPAVGLDLGLSDFIILDNGFKYPNQKYFVKTQKTLRKLQRSLSRKKHSRSKGDTTKQSNNYKKQKLKVQKCHLKINNQRNDYLHKASNKITNDFDIICVESLNIKGLIKNKHLSKGIQDVAWSKFLDLLQYKSLRKQKVFHKINTYFPSSKTCSNCGSINKNLKLEHRVWNCQSCSTTLDRDINAALNIRQQGLLELTDLYRAGTARI